MNQFFCRVRSARLGARLTAMACAAALCTVAFAASAQPDPNQRVGATVADARSPHYRFERFTVASADGQRHWRVHLGIPRHRPGRAGFAALYMLDGNAALMEFDAPLLAQLAAGQAPVLVFVGYDNELRIDTAARTLDYTPSAIMPSTIMPGTIDDGAAAGPRGGGAAAFGEALVARIAPDVRRRARIDRSREGLWGHSLGGLFVLDLLYTRGDAFAQWFTASPSLWWDNGRELGEPERRFLQDATPRPADLVVLQGGRERQRRDDPRRGDGKHDESRPDDSRSESSRPEDARREQDPRVAAQRARIAAVPADAARQLASRLRAKPGLRVCYREFAELGHGPMLRASVRVAALAMAGDPARACRAEPDPAP